MKSPIEEKFIDSSKPLKSGEFGPQQGAHRADALDDNLSQKRREIGR